MHDTLDTLKCLKHVSIGTGLATSAAISGEEIVTLLVGD